MHKAIFLEGSLRFSIRPNGPILIKASDSGAADPTLPSMEFVRTRRNGQNQVYLPGSSLKGVIRAQAERICRSLDSEVRQQKDLKKRREKFQNDKTLYKEPLLPLTDNPFGSKESGQEANQTNPIPDKKPLTLEELAYKGLGDFQFNINDYLNKLKPTGPDASAIVYRFSPLVSQMFGHTSLASHIRFADAYSDDFKPEYLEERNGVAIDRIYGSVAVGPFNYEVVVDGTFTSQIMFKNLSLAQLALLGLSLRDLAEGRIGLGFAKSRGFGHVHVEFGKLELYYPSCTLENNALNTLSAKQQLAAPGNFVGIGALAQGDEYKQYNFPADDSGVLPNGIEFQADEFMGVRIQAEGDAQVRALWGACMPAWKRELGL
jgi:CRISPR/Cas system CSM-associated protein Csm3 (group 7 of RAMP superfamily)